MLRSILLRVLPVLFCTTTACLPASAQRFRGPDRELSKGGETVRNVFKEIVTDANPATVRVRCDGSYACLGTVVSPDGYVLTKASELSGGVAVELRDGTTSAARIVGVAEEHDLAMLKVEATGLTPVEWVEGDEETVGQWVITPGLADSPAAVGVISVGRRKIPARSGMLGVMLADGAGGARVVQVVPESPAEKAGLRVDDVITRVNDEAVTSREDLVTTIRGYMPGLSVTLGVSRGEEKIERRATLAGGVGPGARAEMMNQMGGKLSLRNANFPVVLQHDTVLTPPLCGGPLLNLDGQAVGLNIARAGRVESYAIPADVIVKLLPDLMDGTLAPNDPKSPTTKAAESKNEG